ncbi:MAG: dockerin type I domain-containing protein, partial [Pirellulaceae bacterium]|nr:dockerin type I domain-containing protein [Pirellulaceae bacterium]
MIQTRRNSHGRRERQKAKSRHVRTQRRWLQPERLEERTLLAANPFHNGFWPEDVNNDLRVNAMDALHVINALNQSGSRELLAPGEVAPDMADVPFYTDVSADGALSAVDALRVVNTINGGEGEIAPSDVVRYRLATTDMNGNAISAVNVGQTFQVRGYVQDVRLNGGSTTAGNPTGVFAAYMDVLMTNANLATVRYGETQELRMDATRPGGVWGTGEIRLTYAGQQTGAIPYLASGNEDSAAIQSALEKLSTVGAGNVQVTSLQGADFDGRYFVRFVRNLGERDIAPMTVQGSGLLGSYQDVNDDDQDGDKTEFLPFAPAPQIVDDYISVNPTTPEQEDALFRSSFVFFDPYLNGPSAAEEPLEAGQPAGSRQFGEVGAFINRFSLNSPPTYTPRLEYQVFSLDVRADQSGFVQFSGNAAEQSKTLVFSLPGGGSSNTEVNPANIGFIDPALLAIAAPINVVHDTSTVLEDSGVTSIPVLANDTVNGSAGGVAPLSLVAGGLSAVNPAGSATVSISGNNVNFTPTNNFNGQVTFTYQVRDGKTPTPNTATGTVTVNVTAVNDAPVITLQSLPGPINEDAGAVPIPPGTISVADVDAGNALLQTTIAVTGGTVTLNDTTGLTFTTGDGTADANMVFTGTLTALNNATNNATFNTALNFNGPATV